MKKNLIKIFIVGFAIGLPLGMIEAFFILSSYNVALTLSEQLIFYFGTMLLEGLALFSIFFLLMFLIKFLSKFVISIRINNIFLLILGAIYSFIIFFSLPSDELIPLLGKKHNEIESNKQKNIIFFVVDTLRQDKLGCYGNPEMKTPTCDFLSKQGVLFSETISQIPITAPSHTSIFTGLYPFDHGSRYNGVPFYSDIKTLADIVSSKGVKTLAFVSSAAVNGKITHLSQGFQFYDDKFFINHLNPQWIHVFPISILRKMHLIPISPERSALHTTQRVLPFLRYLNDFSPFFLWIHYYDPHIPYVPPFPYNKFYDADYKGSLNGSFKNIMAIHSNTMIANRDDLKHIASLYQGEASWTDYNIERVLTAFRKQASSIVSKTVIVLTADHGESLLEHNYLFYHGEKLYDQSLKVPLIICNHFARKKGIIYTKVVRLLDLFATFLDIFGIPIPQKSYSKSLVKLSNYSKIQQKYIPEKMSIAENGRLFFIDSGKHDLQLQDKTFALRTKRTKYILAANGNEELYDLSKDPTESSNVINSPEKQPTLSHFRNTMNKLDRILHSKLKKNIKMSSSVQKELESLGYIKKGGSH